MIGATWRVPLVFLDIAGITLGVFAALVLRELYRGHGLHGADVWRRIESPTLPYVMLAMVLVFSYAGMYRSRELRGRGGRLASSSLVVGLLALAASVGTGQGLGEVAIVPSALAFSAALVTLMRWSYQTITDDVLRLARKRGVVMTGLQESERGDNS
jgi:hypothetical protein